MNTAQHTPRTQSQRLQTISAHWRAKSAREQRDWNLAAGQTYSPPSPFAPTKQTGYNLWVSVASAFLAQDLPLPMSPPSAPRVEPLPSCNLTALVDINNKLTLMLSPSAPFAHTVLVYAAQPSVEAARPKRPASYVHVATLDGMDGDVDLSRPFHVRFRVPDACYEINVKLVAVNGDGLRGTPLFVRAVSEDNGTAPSPHPSPPSALATRKAEREKGGKKEVLPLSLSEGGGVGEGAKAVREGAALDNPCPHVLPSPVNSSPVRVRFAPSPTGALHIGGVRTALWDWLLARHTGGTFVLRIEDTDKSREVAGGVQTIIDSLRWYGLDWDEGPEVGGAFGPYVQSERLPIYQKYAQLLIETGHAYYAYDTPEELTAYREERQKRGLPTGYSRRHRDLSDADRARYDAERSHLRVVRLAVPREGTTSFTDAVYGPLSVENRILDDVVLLKSDGFPTYHLAAQIDDHLMQISHVLRGEDWIPSAPLHILLYNALGWTPPTFVHLPNMLGPDRKKLSKRYFAAGALEYPAQGYLREALLNFLALQGWSAKEERDLYSVSDLIAKFDVSGILNHSPISDPEKLLWYNGQYIRQLSLSDLADRTLPFLRDAGLAGDNNDTDYIGRVLALEQERMRTLAEAPALADFFLLPDDTFPYDEKAVQKWLIVPGVGARLGAVRDGFAALSVFDEASTEAVVRNVIEQFAVKGGEVIHPVRVALSGRTTGPGLFETIAVLGQDRCLARLTRAIGIVEAPPAPQ